MNQDIIEKLNLIQRHDHGLFAAIDTLLLSMHELKNCRESEADSIVAKFYTPIGGTLYSYHGQRTLEISSSARTMDVLIPLQDLSIELFSIIEYGVRAGYSVNQIIGDTSLPYNPIQTRGWL